MSEFTTRWVPLLETLPAPLAALLMQQVLREGVMFPRERDELEVTLKSLRLPRSQEMDEAVAAFAALRMPAGMSGSDWQNEPSLWVERFTAGMWSSGQIETYRNAARLAIQPSPPPPANGLGRAVVVVFAEQLKSDGGSATLFRRLRPYGTLYLSVINPTGVEALGPWLSGRAAQSREPYSAWYVGGDDRLKAFAPAPSLATLTYTSLQPARHRLLRMMNEARNDMGTGGPEGLRRAMQALTPDEMGFTPGTDLVMRTFATDVLVGGSGTQLYATTFVQWTAREVLRRAQPQTLVARFTARSQSTSMDMRLAQPTREPRMDFGGSLTDAEMGAHLTRVNLLRLPGAERAHFLAWHEGYGQALLIGGDAQAGAQSAAQVRLSDLLKRIA